MGISGVSVKAVSIIHQGVLRAAAAVMPCHSWVSTQHIPREVSIQSKSPSALQRTGSP